MGLVWTQSAKILKSWVTYPCSLQNPQYLVENPALKISNKYLFVGGQPEIQIDFVCSLLTRFMYILPCLEALQIRWLFMFINLFVFCDKQSHEGDFDVSHRVCYLQVQRNYEQYINVSVNGLDDLLERNGWQYWSCFYKAECLPERLLVWVTRGGCSWCGFTGL